jgi:hypothetical protein
MPISRDFLPKLVAEEDKCKKKPDLALGLMPLQDFQQMIAIFPAWKTSQRREGRKPKIDSLFAFIRGVKAVKLPSGAVPVQLLCASLSVSGHITPLLMTCRFFCSSLPLSKTHFFTINF